MADLLSHLIDAPLANLLIVAGLGFLAVAVLGKISGKIEPGAGGRLMSGLLGVVLLVYGVYNHNALDAGTHDRAGTSSIIVPPNDTQAKSSVDRPIPRPTRINGSLAGMWTNDNTVSRGITKVEVEENGDAVKVHAWGACHPTDCDWGTEKGLVTGDSTSVAWDQGFVLRKMTLSIDATRLRMDLDSVYRDNRPSQHAREYFVRHR